MTVLITGAGRGLGLEIVKKHIELGDRIIALAHSMTDELEQLVMAADKITAYTCELTCEPEIIRIASEVTGSIDILYNVAGLYYFDQNCGIAGTDMESCRKMYDVNAVAPLIVMKAFEKHLSAGSIVMNVSSEAGSIGNTGRQGEYGYCMSKAALNMAGKIFANEHKECRVFCYHPGWIRTRMGGDGAAKSPYSISPEEAAECILKVTLGADKIPENVMYLDYEGRELNW